ncbi:hypothetical protein NKH52_29080 [Mesorhizobium sp. M1066]|uniref:hypothetical protein n=1 Tax=unclassified Mesorhizobium TaxID=325217 RepID=UPI000FCCD26B|nr:MULTISPECIES: hypothetical protein [unclassified Mesorhizobium]RUZ77258.1 hypothetical protein EN943_14470 [Mesorhizobium sp. M7A.F.Ca.US.006.01.1.1]
MNYTFAHVVFPKPGPLLGDMPDDLEKAREAARRIPGGSGDPQAARNTGPVIRIVSTRRREKLVIGGLLAEIDAGIKRLSFDSPTS